MGNDKHISTETATLRYLGKEHIFHIVPENFPLPEKGIIGLPFFNKYDRFAITKDHLIIDDMKLTLFEDGEFIPQNICRLQGILTTDEDGDI